MEPHTRPLYEETFNRIATVLDVIPESQAEHVREMAEIRKAQAAQAEAVTRLTVSMDTLTLKSAETEDKLNALITLMDQHINEHHRKN